ncbi:MAG: ERCC4 domain-containing protein [Gemmatimonadales bacterium]
MTASWITERTGNHRFPFRISIEQGGRLILAVRSQAAWPGPGQNIFCLRERELDPDEPLEVVERVPVMTIVRVGRKLAVVLDRPRRKRCEFLTVEKPRRDGSGGYEQVFFRTESGIRAHRSRTRVELRAESPTLAIVIDSNERYAWRFPGATITTRKLAVGDYALAGDDGIVAVVERKSYDNLLSDFGAIQALHQQLADLASVPAAALVIEAEYRDFLDPIRLKGRWPAAHVARVLGELSALHPKLPIVYAGNRKMANAWAHQFFLSLGARDASHQPQLVMEALTRYDAHPRAQGLDDQIRRAALHDLPQPFAFAALAARFPEVGVPRLRRMVGQLRREGLLVRIGAGRAAKWGRHTLNT